MVRRPLLLVALCAVLGTALYFAAMDVAAVRAADLRTLEGFMGLWALPGASYATNFVGLFDPVPYALLVLGVAAAGVLTGRVRAGLLASGAMLCASATSQILKPLLAVQRDFPPHHYMDAASWPSGHATNVMVFALAVGLVASPRWRALAAAFGGLLTIVTVYALLMLGSHYPSDVLGGLLVATAWGCLAIIPLRAEVRPTLRAPAHAGAVFAGAVALAIAVQPGRAAAYAVDHTTFVAGAVAIAAAALVLSGSVLAPTRAPHGSPPG